MDTPRKTLTLEGNPMKNQTTVENVTEQQLEDLSREAGAAGDMDQVRLCTRAINGDDNARAECARVIAAAAAQEDGL